LLLKERPESSKASLIESSKNALTPHPPYVVIDNNTTGLPVEQILVARTFRSQKDGKHRTKRIEAVRDGSSLESVQTPVLKFLQDCRMKKTKRFGRHLRFLSLKSFHIDHYEVYPGQAKVRDSLIHRANSHRFHRVASAYRRLV
jgi:hypothetical protein